MTEINRERFEAWLFAQPEDRVFNYMDTNGGCVVCAFIRETTDWKEACGGTDYYGVYQNDIERQNRILEKPYTAVPLPDWIKLSKQGVLSASPLTIGNMQARYLQLFPEFLKTESESSLCPKPQ